MTNTTTGVGDGAGYDLELNGNDINYVNRTSSGNQKFWTSSTERMRIEGGGALRITSNDIKSSISGTYYLSGANGNAGNPSYVTYGFVDDVNTGMYRSGADTLSFATGGTSRMSISSTGVISGDGSGLTGVGTSTASMAVGTYALLSGTTGTVLYGTTYSGSSLSPASAKGLVGNAGAWTGAGTWRQMGFTNNGFGDYNTTVFVRIS
jgi:hypothetical protein